MARTSTAQVVIKGNTADLQKNLKKAEKGMQEFKDMGSNALSSIGDLIGVDTRQIGSMVDSVKKLSSGMQAMGSTGNSAFAGLTRGASLLGAGIASIGIAGLVAGFKELNRQAELFASTDFGADFMALQNTWRDTYSMATMGAGEGGKGWLKLTEQFKNGARRAGTIFGNTFANTLQGQNLSQAFVGALQTDKFARGKANATLPYQQALSEAEDFRRDQSKVWAEMETQIRAYERTAKDTSKTEEERNTALQNAFELTTRRGNEMAMTYYKIYNAQKKLNEQAPTSEKAIEDEVAKYNEWQGIVADTEGRLTSLEKLNNRINKSGSSGGSGAGKTATEVDHLAEAIADMNTAVANAVEVNKVFGGTLSDEDVAFKTYESSLERIISAYGVEDERIQKLIKDYTTLRNQRMMSAPLEQVSSTPTAQAVSTTTKEVGIVGWKMPELTAEQKKYYQFLQGMEDATVKANEVISDALVNGISSSIQYLADCLMGLEDFSTAGLFSALMTPIAEACIQIGELIMAEGVAMEAFQKSITNPYAAIAAGAALVAVGALVKAGLQSAIRSVSGGGYSTSVASSAYSSSTGSQLSTFGREMEVKVTGTLTANGSQLVAVLNNEHNRNSYTT